jgi:deazaflavin-dependent oxidoreductase (nitroreductase family)
LALIDTMAEQDRFSTQTGLCRPKMGYMGMDDRVRQALRRDRTIDITTIGRSSGLPRRIETWFYRVGDAIYLTGSPGRRDWYANLLANPEFTFHLKQSVVADLPARAAPITDPGERREIFVTILHGLGQPGNLDAWMAGSPLARVEFAGTPSSPDR